ncbi:hypothetical protein JCM8097_009166 [Rhodosporidiobolus ruineniae]
MLASRTFASALARTAPSRLPCTCTRALSTASSSSPRFIANSQQPLSRPRALERTAGQHVRVLSSTGAARGADDLVNIIMATDDDPVSITSLTPSAGFTLSDGLVVPSPVLIIDGAVFLWDVQHPLKGGDELGRKWDGWSEEKLKVFEALSPRPEILLVGTGTTTCFAPPSFKKYLNNLGIQVDILDSRNAASTYNLLSEEGRRVAAALYPVSELAARTGVVA